MRLLDSSALIAYVNDEPGGEQLAKFLNEPLAISAVNLAETILKLRRLFPGKTFGVETFRKLQLKILPFSQSDLKACVDNFSGNEKDISLADKVCLATAAARHCSVITADRSWTKLELPIEVICIR
ncbi:MAG: PIN domain-containing protein [Candidatus Berkelbacteria bacterium]|nr:PIN domain-containing protein [Candidatus Berkelbacteria bacterium]MCR4307868.1 PIN domain-containing protein [Candidatus Berkelbacteria bacterium]